MPEPLNTVCQGCGYADPDHHVRSWKAREYLMLHTRHTGRCSVTGTSCDEPALRECTRCGHRGEPEAFINGCARCQHAQYREVMRR